MKALIFAAGLGTRLRPLTNDRPKALVEINGQSLLEINIRKLVDLGFDEIVVNVHHFADKMIAFLEELEVDATIHISDEREEVLETGGGLQKAADFLQGEESFLVHNVDILTDLDVMSMMKEHEKLDALATLAIQKRTSSRYLLFDETDTLHGWTNVRDGIVRQKRPTEQDLFFWGFSGVQVISPRIFDLFTRKGKFSIIDTYLDCAKQNIIKGFPHEALWMDVGKPENLEKAKMIFNPLS
ncbi:MAG: nucleotidyltransferase family protein [Saprospiraceae bacterium]